MIHKICRFITLSTEPTWKNKITDFIKVIHPDVHVNAPPHVMNANTVALRELNQYIESITANKGVAHTKITYYSKENHITPNIVELLPLNAGVSQTTLQMHMNKYYLIQCYRYDKRCNARKESSI